jgi:hypothetical protein
MKRSSLLACSLAVALLLSVFSVNVAFAVNSLPSGMSVFTTQKMYVAGQTVNVVGQIFSYSGAGPMLITVYSPDNKAAFSNRIDSAGQIVQYTFALDKNETRLGQWKAVAIYSDLQAEASFALVDKNSLHQAILTKPVLKDSMGGHLVPDRQKAGQPMIISADVENDLDNTSQQFVFVAQVLDENKIPVHLSFVMGSVGASQSASPSVHWTPKAGGAYTVEVFVWNSLGVPVPLADKQATTFVIS